MQGQPADFRGVTERGSKKINKGCLKGIPGGSSDLIGFTNFRGIWSPWSSFRSDTRNLRGFREIQDRAWNAPEQPQTPLHSVKFRKISWRTSENPLNPSEKLWSSLEDPLRFHGPPLRLPGAIQWVSTRRMAAGVLVRALRWLLLVSKVKNKRRTSTTIRYTQCLGGLYFLTRFHNSQVTLTVPH